MRCGVIAATVMMMSIKTYSELILLPTFEERFRYLRLGGRVGEETFGFDRYLNQEFYQRDPEWKKIRRFVIRRDNGCDLAVPDRIIDRMIIVHHMNPITIDDLIHRTDFLLDPEFLVSTVKNTHDAIHYGNEDLLIKAPVERTMNDTCPWRH